MRAGGGCAAISPISEAVGNLESAPKPPPLEQPAKKSGAMVERTNAEREVRFMWYTFRAKQLVLRPFAFNKYRLTGTARC